MQFPSNMIFNNLFQSRCGLWIVLYLIWTLCLSAQYMCWSFSFKVWAFSGFIFSKLLLLAAQWKRVKLSSVKRAIEVSLWSFTKVNGFPRHGGGQWNAKFFPSHFQQKMWKTNPLGSFTTLRWNICHGNLSHPNWYINFQYG